jgi:hypothetical protein
VQKIDISFLRAALAAENLARYWVFAKNIDLVILISLFNRAQSASHPDREDSRST